MNINDIIKSIYKTAGTFLGVGLISGAIPTGQTDRDKLEDAPLYSGNGVRADGLAPSAPPADKPLLASGLSGGGVDPVGPPAARSYAEQYLSEATAPKRTGHEV